MILLSQEWRKKSYVMSLRIIYSKINYKEDLSFSFEGCPRNWSLFQSEMHMNFWISMSSEKLWDRNNVLHNSDFLMLDQDLDGLPCLRNMNLYSFCLCHPLWCDIWNCLFTVITKQGRNKIYTSESSEFQTYLYMLQSWNSSSK